MSPSCAEPLKEENEAITFNGSAFLSSKHLAARFNQQFNTSKLGRHTSSSEIRLVSRETKRKSLEMAQTFTTDLERTAIKSCRNSKVFGPDKLSIFHLKHLGARAIEYITALFNLSVTACQIPAIWKSSLIIPILKPGKDTSIGTSYRPISLLCPAAKVLESLIILIDRHPELFGQTNKVPTSEYRNTHCVTYHNQIWMSTGDPLPRVTPRA